MDRYYVYKDVFVEVNNVAAGFVVPNPCRVFFHEPIRNVVRVEVICFGGFGAYVNDPTYLVLCTEELRGIKWVSNRGPDIAATRALERPNILAVVPFEGPEFSTQRISYPYNPNAPIGQIDVAVPRLDYLTLTLRTSRACALDTRTMYYWCCLRFTCYLPPEQLAPATYSTSDKEPLLSSR